MMLGDSACGESGALTFLGEGERGTQILMRLMDRFCSACASHGASSDLAFAICSSAAAMAAISAVPASSQFTASSSSADFFISSSRWASSCLASIISSCLAAATAAISASASTSSQSTMPSSSSSSAEWPGEVSPKAVLIAAWIAPTHILSIAVLESPKPPPVPLKVALMVATFLSELSMTSTSASFSSLLSPRLVLGRSSLGPTKEGPRDAGLGALRPPPVGGLSEGICISAGPGSKAGAMIASADMGSRLEASGSGKPRDDGGREASPRGSRRSVDSIRRRRNLGVISLCSCIWWPVTLRS
mmetsp:Transcript_22367/g.40266  ORF Transcript_22367/g.40266 Transcript_22367/m.40266 type:complete len:303 (+) Transcript_22367:365-1273(+)